MTSWALFLLAFPHIINSFHSIGASTLFLFLCIPFTLVIRSIKSPELFGWTALIIALISSFILSLSHFNIELILLSHLTIIGILVSTWDRNHHWGMWSTLGLGINYLINSGHNTQEISWPLIVVAVLAVLHLINSLLVIKNETQRDRVAFKNMIRVACHDISNPLTLIYGSAQIAESGVFDKKPEKLTALWPKIMRATDGINKVLNGMRSYESIQEPTRICLEQSRLNDFFQDIIVAQMDNAKSKGITLEVNKTLSPETVLQADGLLLKHTAFSALINNGIRFAQEHSTVKVSIIESNSELKFQVSNIGPQMTQECIDTLYNFDFMNRPLLPEGAKDGGFSLSICKLIVEYCQGSLKFKQAPLGNDFKTDFEITLPCNKA